MSTVTVVPERYLYGVHYWAQWYAHKKPQFEVFEYEGRSADGAYYFFRARVGGYRITKFFQQLNAHGFYPFMLDLKQGEAWLDANVK